VKEYSNRVENFDEGVEHIFHIDCIPIVHQFGAINQFERF